MAINDKVNNDTRAQSVPEILNQTFDQPFQVLMTEGLVYDPNTSNLNRLVQPATAQTQSDGSQKTQIVDSVGGQVDVSTEGTLASVLAELQKKLNSTDTIIADLTVLFRSFFQSITNPPYIDKSANAIRNQVQSGTITTVTTVTTVTGMTNVDSYQGKLLIINQNINAWANSCRSLIS